MNLSPGWQEFLTASAFIALVIFNIILLFKKNTQGTIGEAANTILILQADIKNKGNENSTIKQENAAFKATLTEKDHQLQVLSGVFQGGQDSALMTFIKSFQDYVKANDARMEIIIKSLETLLGKISTNQDHQTSILETQVKNEAGIANRDKNLTPDRSN